MAEPRVLLVDVETSHNLLLKFDLREEFTSHSNIMIERHLFCAAWKWLGDKRTQAVSLLDDPRRFKRDIHDDYHVVKTLHDTLSQADVIVGHNSVKFDVRWVNGRILFHGLQPLPPAANVDTLKVARKMFLLNSNRLDYVGKLLGVGGKTDTPHGLWINAFKGQPKALREMVAYNRRDVELLEAVFKKLQPFIPEHFNRGLYVDGDGCPRCGSEHIQKRGLHKAMTRTYQRYACGSCGGWFRSQKADKRTVARRPL